MKLPTFHWNWSSVISGAVMGAIGFLACWVFVNAIETRERVLHAEQQIVTINENIDALWRTVKSNNDTIKAGQIDIGVMRELVSQQGRKKFEVTIFSPVDTTLGSLPPGYPVDPAPPDMKPSAPSAPSVTDSAPSVTESKREFEVLLDEAQRLRKSTPDDFRQERLMEQRAVMPREKK